MADWYKAIVDEIDALVAATWTEVSSTGILTQINYLSRNIVSQASGAINNSDPKKIAPPYAIIAMGKTAQEKGLSVDPTLYRLPLSIWYVAAKVGTTSDTNPTLQEFVASRANVLLAAFQAGSFSTFEVFGDDIGAVDSSADVAFATESLKMLAAGVMFETGLLVRLQ